MKKSRTQMRNVHQKKVDALGNFSRTTKLYSKFGLPSIESLFFFSFRLHQRSRLLHNLHCNSLLLSKNNENCMFYLDCSLHWLVGDFQEFCQIACQTIFQLFNHVIILSVIDTFRLSFLRMMPQPTSRF